MGRTRRSPSLLAPLLAAGCVSFGPGKQEPPRLYALDAAFEEAPALAREGPAILVSVPVARPGYQGAEMAYVRDEHRIEYFARNRWVDTPAAMLAPLLVRALERQGRFSAVTQAPGGVLAPLRLDTEIAALRQEFWARPSRVRLSLRAQLVDAAARRVVATRELEVLEQAPSDDPAGGAAAANRAAVRAAKELAAWCASEAAAPR